MVDRDAGRGRRFSRPDARQKLSGRPARPTAETTRHGPDTGRRRALNVGVGLLDAQTRRALPRPRSRLAPPPKRRSAHPTASSAARTPGPHRDHQPSRLKHRSLISVEFAGPTLPQPALWSGIHGSVWDIELRTLSGVRATDPRWSPWLPHEELLP